MKILTNSYKHRKKWLLIFVGVFLLSAQTGYWIPISDSDAQILYDTFLNSLPEISESTITLHNFSLNLVMFIPGFGMVFGAFTAIQTGIAFNVANIVNDMSFEVTPALVLLITPFGLMELFAYAIAMSRSFILMTSLKNIMKMEKSSRNKILKNQIKGVSIDVGIVGLLLIAGGIIEYWMITEIGNILDYVDLI